MTEKDAASGKATRLTHLDETGAAHMVDVSMKPSTKRTATAEAVLTTRAEVVQRLMAGELPKGEALAVARVAGIMGAKRTSELVPLCHPLPLSSVSVELQPSIESPGADGERGVVRIRATTATTGPTGVEMEALTAASVAALTLYDMIKGLDRGAVISGLRVVQKAGGASGDWMAV